MAIVELVPFSCRLEFGIFFLRDLALRPQRPLRDLFLGDLVLRPQLPQVRVFVKKVIDKKTLQGKEIFLLPKTLQRFFISRPKTKGTPLKKRAPTKIFAANPLKNNSCAAFELRR